MVSGTGALGTIQSIFSFPEHNSYLALPMLEHHCIIVSGKRKPE
jgi:hypothetical protein